MVTTMPKAQKETPTQPLSRRGVTRLPQIDTEKLRRPVVQLPNLEQRPSTKVAAPVSAAKPDSSPADGK